MEKLTFSQLEAARSNPQAFKDSLSNPPWFNYSHNQLLQVMILRMHKYGKTRDETLSELQTELNGHFPRSRRHGEVIERFNGYCDSFAASGLSVANTRLKVSVNLSKGHESYLISGSVPRVDFAPDGRYTAVIFCNQQTSAISDPRVVFAQAGVARVLGADPEDVLAGIYDFQRSEHEFVDITESMREQRFEEFIDVFEALR